jgi:hypothetical protein
MLPVWGRMIARQDWHRRRVSRNRRAVGVVGTNPARFSPLTFRHIFGTGSPYVPDYVHGAPLIRPPGNLLRNECNPRVHHLYFRNGEVDRALDRCALANPEGMIGSGTP